jgi:hypothetical protein
MLTKFTQANGKVIWIEASKVLTIHEDAKERTLVFLAGGMTFFALAEGAEYVRETLEKANKTHLDLILKSDLAGKLMAEMLASGMPCHNVLDSDMDEATKGAGAILERIRPGVYKGNDSETAANEVQDCEHREKVAVAKCETCGRYTDDREVFSLCDVKCECGVNDWIYDFVDPDHKSKWSKHREKKP